MLGFRVAGDGTDVADPAVECGGDCILVEGVTPRRRDDSGLGTHWQVSECVAVVVVQHSHSVGEPLGVGVLLPVVDNGHDVAQFVAERGEFDADVAAAGDVQSRTPADAVHEHVYLSATDHPGVATLFEFVRSHARFLVASEDGAAGLDGQPFDGPATDGAVLLVGGDEHPCPDVPRCAPLFSDNGEHRRRFALVEQLGQISKHGHTKLFTSCSTTISTTVS